ncbi:MAG: hypothetical protein K5637_01645 [Lachnospiraceae bacterium]|nr:hypothetical protein [Lachnospiraceae bacterium]
MSYTENWYRLDNAAKIIPSTAVGADTRVFRIACELKENVDPDVLQDALDSVMEEFPYMDCCLRRGVFWYYLDRLHERPLVEPENRPALSAIYIPGHKSHLFRVSYFQRRINLEMFHVLSDGTGGFTFLKHLLTEYIVLKYGLEREKYVDDTSSASDKERDAFKQYEKKLRTVQNPVKWVKKIFATSAYQLRGIKDENLELHLIEGTVPVAGMLEIAHNYGTTIGILSVSLFIESVIREMDLKERKKKIVFSVPVNLRQFFDSPTVRNFYAVMLIKYDPQMYDGSFRSIIDTVSRVFDENLKEERVLYEMSDYTSLENNLLIRLCPLFLKDIGVWRMSYMRGRGITSSISNLGKIDMPDEIGCHISKFAAFMACKTVFVCISTFEDKMVFGITSPFRKHMLALNFFRNLAKMGIQAEIAGNDYDAEEKDNADMSEMQDIGQGE